MRKHIEIVLPVWNELPNILPLVAALDAATSELRASFRFSYLFINDGSTDGSRPAIEKLCAERDDIRAVHLIHNFGHSAAIRCGLAHAEADAVVLMDADLQDSPAALSQMLACWSDGAQTVVAVRGRRAEPHRWMFQLFYFVLRRLAPGYPPFGTFCLLDRAVVDRLLTLKETTRYFPALVAYASDSFATVSVDRQARHQGSSKVGGRGLVKLAVTAFLNASDLPVRLASLVGGLSALAAIGGMVMAAGIYLFARAAVPGWLLLLIAMLLMSGIQLLCVGLVGEYVARIYAEIKQRPAYFVDATGNSQNRRKVA